ncbi:sulfite exporter TauE/SafE family protein [Solirhodobacter olei]|uniref:sulfite exporter TauE/SafE family protein n=1 Tax=Solirhodobacter olei TaxID=2493082 RepID=UPI000FD7BBEF|nr:sulfite exporter TauE/SafE family protein [Solirhodobacter olei]
MSLSILAVAALVVALAGFAQGVAGIGFALIVAPVIGYVRPDLMPATLLVLMIPLNLFVAAREWPEIDRRGASWVTVGRLAGTFGGIAVLATIPPSSLHLLIGAAIILAVLASVTSPVFVPGHKAFLTAGVVAGVAETATGVGGPPLALVYQHHEPKQIRATIAICFLIGEVVSLASLLAVGRVNVAELRFAVALMPAVALGVLASRHAHGWLSARLARQIVLGFALVSGVILLAH